MEHQELGVVATIRLFVSSRGGSWRVEWSVEALWHVDMMPPPREMTPPHHHRGFWFGRLSPRPLNPNVATAF